MDFREIFHFSPYFTTFLWGEPTNPVAGYGWKSWSHLQDGQDRKAASVEATLEWGVHSKPRFRHMACWVWCTNVCILYIYIYTHMYICVGVCQVKNRRY